MSKKDDQLVGVTEKQLREQVKLNLVEPIFKLFDGEDKPLTLCMTLGAIIGTVIGQTTTEDREGMLGLMTATNFIIHSCAAGVVQIPGVDIQRTDDDDKQTQH